MVPQISLSRVRSGSRGVLPLHPVGRPFSRQDGKAIFGPSGASGKRLRMAGFWAPSANFSAHEFMLGVATYGYRTTLGTRGVLVLAEKNTSPPDSSDALTATSNSCWSLQAWDLRGSAGGVPLMNFRGGFTVSSCMGNSARMGDFSQGDPKREGFRRAVQLHMHSKRFVRNPLQSPDG